MRLRAEHLDAGTVASLAKEKIVALTVLLKEQTELAALSESFDDGPFF